MGMPWDFRAALKAAAKLCVRDAKAPLRQGWPKGESISETSSSERSSWKSSESSEKQGFHVETPATSIATESEGTQQQLPNPLRHIPDEAYALLLLRHLAPDRARTSDVHIGEILEGSFNIVQLLLYQGQNWVIKVPYAGYDDRWSPERAYILRSEVSTMKLIHQATEGRFPVPKILAYDDTKDNELSAPYIIMERLPGIPALDVWYDCRDEEVYYYDPESSYEKREQRERFLWSLAEKMSELRALSFDRIGMLMSNDMGLTSVVPHIQIDPFTDAITVRPPHQSFEEFYAEKLLEKYPRSRRTAEQQKTIDLYTQILQRTPLLAPTKHEDGTKHTFVLAHPDLNVQNILCDPNTGEVTGIIDWDSASTVPRCIGYTSVPLFLRSDWTPTYNPSDPYSNLPIQELQHYREVYANAMKTVMGCQGDCRFTVKSVAYETLHSSLFPGAHLWNGEIENIVSRVLEGMDSGREGEDECNMKEKVQEFMAPEW